MVQALVIHFQTGALGRFHEALFPAALQLRDQQSGDPLWGGRFAPGAGGFQQGMGSPNSRRDEMMKCMGDRMGGSFGM
uniref:Uncharacterized protein n=1 Tax=Magnetococcus massalia (strain MO-1) TaxID=451514 RepID=A0A1S7LH96_MAGMO|nr:protein of unknown function [Candidatus Magnetococcus massalia]